MGKISRCFFLLVAVTAVTCYACAAAQQAPAQGREAVQTQPTTAMTFQGSLVQVNTDTKTLIVKNAENKEMQFVYTEKTVITGAENSAQGLAGKSGERVKVTYMVDHDVNQASRIEILPFY